MLHSGNNFKLRKIIFVSLSSKALFLLSSENSSPSSDPASLSIKITIVSATDWENITSFLCIKHTKAYVFNLEGNVELKEMPKPAVKIKGQA